MKKIKLSNKLSLNKENVSILNSSEQLNAQGGRIDPGPGKTNGEECIIVCLTFGDCTPGTLGCVCSGSLVKTCGIYCPTDA